MTMNEQGRYRFGSTVRNLSSVRLLEVADVTRLMQCHEFYPLLFEDSCAVAAISMRCQVIDSQQDE